MKKHTATWLLAVLVALGAGQAVPLSSLRRNIEPSAIAQVAREHREQHARRVAIRRTFPAPHLDLFACNAPLTAVQNPWSALLLRAPPLSPLD